MLAHQDTTLARRSNHGLPRNHVNLVVALLAVVCAGTVVPQTPLATSLLVIAVVGEAFTVQFRGVRISGSFAALVLAMALLGPVPAAAIAVARSLFDQPDTPQRCWRELLWNTATFARFPLIGGWHPAAGRQGGPDRVRRVRRARVPASRTRSTSPAVADATCASQAF